MNTLIDKLKAVSFWTITKALPFDDGPSSTRAVYLATALSILFCLIMTTAAFSWVYVHDPKHVADVVVAGLIGTLATGAFGFAANSQNLKHTLLAQKGTDVSTVATSPLTSEAVSSDGGEPPASTH